MINSKTAQQIINQANKIVIIQAENPDGDSLGSALGLAEILQDLGKKVSLYCPVEIPKYLRYIKNWDLVDYDLDTSSDLGIIVDTSSETLISKIIASPVYNNFLNMKQILVLDHHKTEPTIKFTDNFLIEDFSSNAELVLKLAEEANWSINPEAATALMCGLMSDTLGFSTQSVSQNSFLSAATLTKLGAQVSEIEEARREFMKKAPEILAYKGRLIDRIEYFADGKLALVDIPFSEIEAYSDQYNPSVLVIDEMRLVTGVDVAVVIKTYPDGKLTGKIRTNIPIAADVAGYFGGGGHDFAAGFRVYEDKQQIIRELIEAVEKITAQKAEENG